MKSQEFQKTLGADVKMKISSLVVIAVLISSCLCPKRTNETQVTGENIFRKYNIEGSWINIPFNGHNGYADSVSFISNRITLYKADSTVITLNCNEINDSIINYGVGVSQNIAPYSIRGDTLSICFRIGCASIIQKGNLWAEEFYIKSSND